MFRLETQSWQCLKSSGFKTKVFLRDCRHEMYVPNLTTSRLKRFPSNPSQKCPNCAQQVAGYLAMHNVVNTSPEVVMVLWMIWSRQQSECGKLSFFWLRMLWNLCFLNLEVDIPWKREFPWPPSTIILVCVPPSTIILVFVNSNGWQPTH